MLIPVGPWPPPWIGPLSVLEQQEQHMRRRRIMTIKTKEAAERIRRARFHAEDELEGRASAKKMLAELIAKGLLTLYAEKGMVKGHTIYPSDSQWPATELDSWSEPEEVIAARAIFSSVTDFDFEDGTLHSFSDDTGILIRPENLSFPRLWLGCCVTIELAGLAVDPDELDNVQMKKRAGRKPPYDWKAFRVEALRCLEYHGGISTKVDPGPDGFIQARLEEEMINWCHRTWGREPGVGTIRKYVQDAIAAYNRSRMDAA
ncbi:MAG: hypothetical protein B7Y95_14815 [Rhizobiales bacterium 32-66-11]|nr:MAG: hypothetical protein B7Y95_14815 [Rhizobiales bacterium 32-66-11]